MIMLIVAMTVLTGVFFKAVLSPTKYRHVFQRCTWMLQLHLHHCIISVASQF